MPQLGETVAEGKISKWFVSAGDAVKPGDNLFEIETDKVSMEVPAIAAGTLAAIHVQAGEVAPVGAVVAIILGSGRDGAPTASRSAHPRESGGPEDQRTGSPLSRGRAEDNVNARHPDGAVPRGALARAQLRPCAAARRHGGHAAGAAARGRSRDRPFQASRAPARTAASWRATSRRHVPSRPAAARGASAEQVKALYRDVPYEEVPLDGMRATIAARLTQAVQTIPHFYLSMDVATGRLMALRAEANAAAPTDGAASSSRSTT